MVVGDVAEARLGLDRETFDRLAGEVDRIVHPAALVNHVLAYDLLFGANVLGTAELVGLAVTGRLEALRLHLVTRGGAAISTGAAGSTSTPHCCRT